VTGPAPDPLAVLASVRRIAVLGASADPARPSHDVMAFLLARGYDILPVSPKAAGGTLLGVPAYARLADVPEPVEMVDVFRRPEAVPQVVEETLACRAAKGIRVLWLQLGVRDAAAEARAAEAGLAVVADRCPKIELSRRNPA
jgi:hypothetical protein